MFFDTRIVEVVNTADVVNAEDFEDVVESYVELHIGCRGHRMNDGDAITRGEFEERGRGGERVVLGREMAVEGLEAYNLTQLESFDERDAVEELAREVPFDHERGVTVVDELEVVDHREHVARDDVAVVGHRHDEQWEGNTVPLDATTQADVDAAIGVEPYALIGRQLGEVVVVVVGEHAWQAHGMGKREDRVVVVDDMAPLLGVDDLFARCPANGSGDVGHVEMRDIDAVGASIKE